jgi:hypothetical protein
LGAEAEVVTYASRRKPQLVEVKHNQPKSSREAIEFSGKHFLARSVRCRSLLVRVQTANLLHREDIAKSRRISATMLKN